MILIGERINAGFKDIKAAIGDNNADVIKDWARKQAAGKADYIDVNMGTASNKAETLCWMIEQVQSVVDLPISIDNNKPAIIKEAIKVCNKPPLVNSTTAVDEKLDEMLPIIAEHSASFIGLVMDEDGTPKSADKRIENAGKIIAKAMEHGIPTDHVFLDPIIMPVKHMQDQCKEILNAASQFHLFADPPCHVVCGLSNAASGTTHKKLINRTFAAMLIASGLDAIILNVLDDELVNTILTAELIMNRSIFADSYIEAFRQ